MIKKIILGVVLLLVVIQFIPVDRETPEVDYSKDFFRYADAPAEIKSVIVGACYDCHSYETSHPWYSYLAPVSWWIMDHVDEGREHLNFSVWGDYSAKRQAHKLSEAYEEVEEHHMPLDSYAWMHEPARLSEEQRAALVDWFKQQYNDFEK